MDISRTPPKRLQILIALQQLLQTISVSNGAAFDMQGRVYRGRLLFGADVSDDPPALSVIEAPRAEYADFGGDDRDHRKDQWTLMIQGIVADDKTERTTDDAYYLCQDVERCLHKLQQKKPSGSPLFPEFHMLGGKITSVEIAPPVIRPPEAQVSSHTFFYLPIRVGVAVEIGE